MHVIATAGHVDHGKSTLVRALTGMEPDRWAEERRRGMTIDIGFGWTTLDFPRGAPETVAFVDVPGHERFVPNMLAGVGPVPAVLVVVAADEGWMPQTAEHIAAIDALQVRHGVLAVTRSDLADPAPVLADARARLARTSLGAVDAVAVAVRPDGPSDGLPNLRAALARMVRALPEPDVESPVRLWVDRAFTVPGAGTVVTGTLSTGSLHQHDTVLLAPSGRELYVRGLQSLGRPVTSASAVARVAVNLRGLDKDGVHRGDALVSNNRVTAVVDVRLHADDEVAGELMAHVGSAALSTRARPLAPGIVRLTLAAPLPLRVGDRLLLRDPGRHAILAGAQVLDVEPPPLARRGAAAARGAELATGSADPRAVLRRRGIVRAGDLPAAEGLPAPLARDWLVDPDLAGRLREQLVVLVSRHARRFPLDAGPSVEAMRQALGLPERALVEALAAGTPLVLFAGRVVDARRASVLPPAVAAGVTALRERLVCDPFDAPDAADLARLGLGARELAAAERVGVLLRIAPGIVLLPDAPDIAARRLRALPAPFSVSQARQALQTTRRVAVPLLELLDRLHVTARSADGSRHVTNLADVETAAPPTG